MTFKQLVQATRHETEKYSSLLSAHKIVPKVSVKSLQILLAVYILVVVFAFQVKLQLICKLVFFVNFFALK